MKPHFLQPLLKSGEERFGLRNERTGQTVVAHLEIARDSAQRRKGLLGRTGLESASALVIAPCSAIHTFFMKFTIDVAFVDRRGIVLKACHGIPPWRIATRLGAFAALEFQAGTLERTTTGRGDRLIVESAR